jgi:hypothetical protein
MRTGGMAEWLKAPVLKTGRRETVSWVRIPLPPPNFVILLVTVCLLFFKGAYDTTALTALLITIPSGLIAAQIGIMVYRRLSDDGFRRLLIILTLLMGLGVLVSELI